MNREAEVTGLDISEAAIKSLNERWPECRAVCASMMDSGLDSDSYDAVAIVGGLHHLHPDVLIYAIRQELTYLIDETAAGQ